ncbi:D-2-hydroxyacid dehydrogenase [Planctomicrobium sp. SH661]|uniref:D-2-hydroxyacid dehydrogenase n=1 Tax=Planctomicrobium sp. SH661 TaxID=3448124 RepID=UPI003F5BE078
MKLVIFPAIDDARLSSVKLAASEMTVANCGSPAKALEEIPDADAFFGKITPELLAAATNLRWVQAPTVSLEHYIFPELAAHSCVLTNMRGLFSDVVADHVMGFVLMIARNLHVYLRQQQQHLWHPIGQSPEQQTLAGSVGTVTGIDRNHLHLADCTLGVIGVGQIGAEICRRAAAFGMTVIGIDPLTRSVPGVIDSVQPLSELSDLLQASDFVCIAAPHTPETVKMFRTAQFEQMKRTAWLINIGRGAIVDLNDLDQALENKVIAGAALDVFETEPLPADHPLWKRENVIITPHVAAASPRIAERHLQTLLKNVTRFASGQPLLNVADKAKWY